MKAIKIFTGVDLIVSHDGLKEYAKKHKVDLKELRTGEVAIFVNTKKDKMKSYAWNGVLSYLRRTEYERPFDLQAFNAFSLKADGTISYVDGLKARLEKVLRKRGALDEAVL